MASCRRQQHGYVLLLLCAVITASFFAWPQSTDQSSQVTAHYKQAASLGIQHLQSWYNPSTGLYNSTGWWNAANAIATLADYTRATGDNQYENVFANTFTAAQHTSPGFLNKYYDDEGWWALSWINAYDLTGRRQYLQMADSIFNDMAKGWDDTCSGGIWWSKDRKYKNAIANELFLSVAAHLLSRATDEKQKAEYLSWAQREVQWFSRSGMINSSHQINDGLDAHCRNNHQTVWTYNQGVILGGLSELYKQTREPALLNEASEIAGATLSNPSLVDSHGILHDPCEPNCGGDGTQFKGIFVRNLAMLQRLSPSPSYEKFILANADSISAGMHPPGYGIGTAWAAPYGSINASTQSSGEDTLVAAAFLGTSLHP